MSPTHTRKGNRLYRYYVSQDVLKRGPEACPVGRVPAAEIEAAVIDQLRGVFRQPEIIVGTWRAARAEQDDITEDEAREALTAARPAVGRAVPGRAGADRAAAGRAGRRADARRRGPAAAERARRAGAGSGGQQEGSGMNTQGDGLGGRRDDHDPHPDDVQEARRAEDGGDAGRRAVGAAAAGRQRAWSRRWRGRSGGSGCWTRASAGRSRSWRKREKVNRGYMSRVLRLTLLAPDLVEVILEGRQGPQVNLTQLLDCVEVGWEAQRLEIAGHA